ncbi:MAG: FadR/GntR family transcriptional regulator [Solirubrobacteraceae bacterium]
MTAVTRQTLTDRVAEGVLELIFEEEIGVGEPLPSSAALAKRFDVSVVVIREAMATLAGRGILNRRQGRESVVAMPGHEMLSATLSHRAKQELITHDELLQCRAGLELQSAVLAAAQGTPDGRRAVLEQALDRMRKARDRDAFNAADLQFHADLASLSGNRALVLILSSLHSVIRDELFRRIRRLSAAERRESVERHARIARAVALGDRRGSAEAMAAHFEHAVGGLDIGRAG